MANVLPREKQIAIIGALAEGASMRAITRMTGIHRDTVCRLGVRIGEGCARLLDAKMRDLTCHYLQFDEIWGFIGKKEKHRRETDNPTLDHMRRLTRLTYAFSKKLENFEAAVALHFAYYNFVRTHGSLKMTPAMAAGIERKFWTVEDLVEAAL